MAQSTKMCFPSEDLVRKCRTMRFAVVRSPILLRLRSEGTAGIGREVDGGGMAGGGSGWPGDGAENALRLWRGGKVTALPFERPSGRSFSLRRRRRCSPASGCDALLEGPVLGLSGAGDEEP